MAGVEAAGLVLAAFPVVLECIHKLKEMRNHRAILRQMEREIRAERTIFKNSWNRLLELAGEDKILGTLSATSHYSMDHDSVISILDICEDLLGILEELKHKFGIGPEETTVYS